jgi:hypothetical protein
MPPASEYKTFSSALLRLGIPEIEEQARAAGGAYRSKREETSRCSIEFSVLALPLGARIEAGYGSARR